ncbi:DUF488 family protein, N3 subclade [Geobacillus thermocatenulatus]|uniref:DUF488 family protein, N3 subclade n=1 Tax=Geobacillus thermocatenulatus TaxID=33938 RepID=UPI00209F8230|nr:DUF488 family protein [Geobacillus thermocatenulatus]
MFQTKRIYIPAERDDGIRILVDRLWPRCQRSKRAVTAGERDCPPAMVWPSAGAVCRVCENV